LDVVIDAFKTISILRMYRREQNYSSNIRRNDLNFMIRNYVSFCSNYNRQTSNIIDTYRQMNNNYMYLLDLLEDQARMDNQRERRNAQTVNSLYNVTQQARIPSPVHAVDPIRATTPFTGVTPSTQQESVRNVQPQQQANFTSANRLNGSARQFYPFGGVQQRAYTTTNTTNPINVLGQNVTQSTNNLMNPFGGIWNSLFPPGTATHPNVRTYRTQLFGAGNINQTTQGQTNNFTPTNNFFDAVRVTPTQDDIARACLRGPYQSIETNYNMCPIDLHTFAADDEILRIRHCGHIFRSVNLEAWFTHSPRCPVCRYDIRNYIDPQESENAEDEGQEQDEQEEEQKEEEEEQEEQEEQAEEEQQGQSDDDYGYWTDDGDDNSDGETSTIAEQHAQQGDVVDVSGSSSTPIDEAVSTYQVNLSQGNTNTVVGPQNRADETQIENAFIRSITQAMQHTLTDLSLNHSTVDMQYLFFNPNDHM